MPAGLIPARPSAPLPQGPLSYLSTVTTASTSDWGSRSLDSLSQQPSDLTPVSTPPLPPAPVAGVTQNTASNGGRHPSEGQGDKGLGQKPSGTDQSLVKQGRSSSHNRRDVTDSAETATGNSINQGPAGLSKPQSTASGARVDDGNSHGADAPSNKLQQRHPARLEDSFSGSPARFSWESTANATARETDSADWDAFGGSANQGRQAQLATPSHTNSELESSHDLVAGTSQTSAAQDEWSPAFGVPGSASFGAAPSGLDDSTQEAAQAAADWNATNPFLEPGQDPWQHDSRASSGDITQVTRVASGDSFGDFNAPGEGQDDFEGASRDAAAASAEDQTHGAAAVPAVDPFAASGSFTDFAALLEPTQTQLLGDLNVTSADTASLQISSVGQFDLSELQGNHDLAWQQGLQTSAWRVSNSGGLGSYLTSRSMIPCSSCTYFACVRKW